MAPAKNFVRVATKWKAIAPMSASSTSVENLPALYRLAQIYHAANLHVQAEGLCRRILTSDPGHALAIKTLVLILIEKGDDAQVESILIDHLKRHPDSGASQQGLGQLRARQGDHDAAVKHFECAAESLPFHAPLFNDLGVSLHQLGCVEKALVALDRAVELDPAFALAHDNRGIALFDSKRFDEAMHAHLLGLIACEPSEVQVRASILRNLAKAARKADRLPLAEQVIRAEVESNFSSAAAEQLAVMLDDLSRPEEAKAIRNESARRTRVHWIGRSQRSKATILLIGAVGGNHIPTGYLIDSDIFSTLSVTLPSPDRTNVPFGAAEAQALKRVDIVFNVLGDADCDEGQLAAAGALCKTLGKPVLNPPNAILKTGRGRAAELFGGIDGMITPAARRASTKDLAEQSVTEPILVRPPGDHGGDRLTLLRSDSEKEAYLTTNPERQLVLTPFYDFRSPDGYWRKYRLIFIDREIFPYHLAIGSEWLVHYWRAEMARADWKRKEEECFLADWRSVFGKYAANAVEEAARRMDLDYCGMDCALTRDGRVLLFESNACMLIHLCEPPAAFPYKHRYVPLIREAFTRLVLSRARSCSAQSGGVADEDNQRAFTG